MRKETCDLRLVRSACRHTQNPLVLVDLDNSGQCRCNSVPWKPSKNSPYPTSQGPVILQSNTSASPLCSEFLSNIRPFLRDVGVCQFSCLLLKYKSSMFLSSIPEMFCVEKYAKRKSVLPEHRHTFLGASGWTPTNLPTPLLVDEKIGSHKSWEEVIPLVPKVGPYSPDESWNLVIESPDEFLTRTVPSRIWDALFCPKIESQMKSASCTWVWVFVVFLGLRTRKTGQMLRCVFFTRASCTRESSVSRKAMGSLNCRKTIWRRK